MIGRFEESDVIIKDISVSRKHGTINYNKDRKITLKDLGSKFGTLVLIQDDFTINNNRVSLQIGRTFLDIKCLPLYEYVEIESSRRKFRENSDKL